jgi:hypothetical protein
MAGPPGKLERLADELKELSDKLASEEASQLPAARASLVRKTISEAYEKLRKVIEDLDPIKRPGFVFEPSDPNVAGRVVGIALIAPAGKTLLSLDRFYGSGVYALYFGGVSGFAGGAESRGAPPRVLHAPGAESSLYGC